MASCSFLPSSSISDPSGSHRERTSMAMDLHRRDQFHTSSQVQRQLKGKNVANSILGPPPSTDSLLSDSVPDQLGIKVSHASIPILGVSFEIRASSAPAPKLAFLHLWQIWKKYSLCLIGQFMGLSPKLGLMQAMATKLWGRHSPVSVFPYTEGLFLYQFLDESSLSRALHGGPWHIGGIPLLLRNWTVGIKPVDFSVSLIPVWVQLNHVPFELLTNEGLSYLTSALGKPSHMNLDCSKMLSSDRVSVCVDVDFSKPLLDELTVEFEGCQRTIGVSYSWKPQPCDSCNKWGHHKLACPTKRSTVQWVPKTTIVVPPTTDKSNQPANISVSPPISSSSIYTIAFYCNTY
ncbi:hypothetical protein Tsubulata_001234 [Turnera subulata]|uniref:DUF4283 domain-containing protein n=1 Tax=Turnera subulata TaxID=218843 RepID=A0A9Q0F7V2_9ROSI|nr:hypothetical protein Tsubulata_001234 [Turnera subulata]